MKKCNACGLEKSLENFYSQKGKCKICYNLSRKERYEKNDEYRRKRTRQIQDRKYLLRKTDPIYNLKFKISQRMRSLCKNGKCQKELFKKYNINAEEIIQKIGLKPDKEYHLDHIIPISAFNHNDMFEVWCCWNCRNLQWLPSKQNIAKKDKYDLNMKEKYLAEMKIMYSKLQK